jgi:serine acetyltransferase
VQVGANAVVNSSFGSDVVVAGAPARVIRAG